MSSVAARHKLPIREDLPEPTGPMNRISGSGGVKAIHWFTGAYVVSVKPGSQYYDAGAYVVSVSSSLVHNMTLELT